MDVCNGTFYKIMDDSGVPDNLGNLHIGKWFGSPSPLKKKQRWNAASSCCISTLGHLVVAAINRINVLGGNDKKHMKRTQ